MLAKTSFKGLVTEEVNVQEQRREASQGAGWDQCESNGKKGEKGIF